MSTTDGGELRLLGEAAAAFVQGGMKVGLGTGRAATAFVRTLGERVRRGGLDVSCVATSEATASLAAGLGLPLISLAEAGELDITIDGADEVDPCLDLIKGLGGALVREKIVAASSRRLIIVVGAEKLVQRLGEKTPVPVEIVPFGAALCERRVRALGALPTLRRAASGPYVTDNGNQILDCKFPAIDDPGALDREIREIPGVVATGLFVGMAERVLVEERGAVREIHRAS